MENKKKFEFILYFRSSKIRDVEGKLFTPLFIPSKIQEFKELGFKRGNENSDFYREEIYFLGGKIEALNLAEQIANRYSEKLNLPLEYRISMRGFTYNSHTKTTRRDTFK